MDSSHVELEPELELELELELSCSNNSCQNHAGQTTMHTKCVLIKVLLEAG